MALVRWRNRGELSPWSALRDLEDQFSRIFGTRGDDLHWFEGAWSPAVDVTETDDTYTIDVDLPGMKKGDIELVVVDNVVTLKGERKNEHETKSEGYHRFERRYGSFQRSFEIPGGFDANKVAASFENGVLHVTLPKREEAKPKQIEVAIK